MSGRARRIVNHRAFYLLLLPASAYYILFCYLPMFGVVLAFKELDYSKGIWMSPWVGLANFEQIFKERDFWSAVKNTVVIAGLRLLIEFPAPIIIALLIDQVRSRFIRGSFQTIVTFPHFLSWIVVSGMALNLFGSSGLVNSLLSSLGLPNNRVLTNSDDFRWFLVFSNLWKEAGWGCIIYLSAISGINPEMYEAAELDGASPLRQMTAITVPAISSTIAVMLILFLSGVMNSGGGGFDQVFNLQNPSVVSGSDIIDTYIYRRTFYAGDSFESSTAVGLFKSVINFALVLGANYLTRKIGEEGVI
jgi:ABC-type polysaccharide transport system, permease component